MISDFSGLKEIVFKRIFLKSTISVEWLWNEEHSFFTDMASSILPKY
jgi:hypothetical protein